MSNYRHWTPEEEQYIRDHWQTQTEAEMAAALDRPEGAVRAKRRGIRCSPKKTWLPEEEEYLEEHWGAISLPGLARHLGRTVNAIKVRAFRLGLGGMLSAGDYVTFNQLMLTLTDNAQSYSYQMKSWVKNRGLPIRTKRVDKCVWRIVYLGRVKAMAKDTNYTYDEITGYSKLLLNTYDTEKTLSVLKTLSDASAGLNLNSSDVNMFISGLSRMRTTGKTTQEYLNYFSERGVDVYQALANSTGADKSSIAEMVTDGKISGEDAAEAILTYINDTYGGLSEKLATTYDAMVDNLSDFQADMDAAMGEGYNEGRKAGIQAQMDWMSGESGEAVEEANRAIGAWKAELENQKEQYVRDAMDAMMASDEYQTAKAEGDAAEMGKLIMQAKVQGMNEYNASEGAQLALESEKALVTSIRNDTVLNQNYWDAGYEKGQEFSKGMAAARRDNYWSGYQDQIDQLESASAEKDETISAQASQLQEQADTISQKDAELQQKEDTITQQAATIGQKDTEIQQKEDTIAEQAATITEQTKTLGDQAATIQSQAEQIKTLEASGGGAAITAKLEAAYTEGVESNG